MVYKEPGGGGFALSPPRCIFPRFEIPGLSRTTMSIPFSTRQVTFGRSAPAQTQQYPQSQPQPYGQTQPQPQQANGLALPFATNPYLPGPTNLALPGPAPVYPSQPQPTQVTQPAQSQQPATQSQSPTVVNASQPTAGPSSPPAAAPATPAPLTLEQQTITAVDGIVPTLQNIVATVNLDCRLDLKTIALHARNAEYNPKVGAIQPLM